MCRKVVVFDLDDTLYKEIDFLKSGYRKIADMVEKRYAYNAVDIFDSLYAWYLKGENPFVNLNKVYGIDNPISDYLSTYRHHHPSITLAQETANTLKALKDKGCLLGIITDGREITQKQKNEALGLGEWIENDNIIVNEIKDHFKPNHYSFDRFMLHCFEQYPNIEFDFCYVGDNIEKDFLAPNQLGWETICLLDDGRNIHKQDFSLSAEYLPHHKVTSLEKILGII